MKDLEERVIEQFGRLVLEILKKDTIIDELSQKQNKKRVRNPDAEKGAE